MTTTASSTIDAHTRVAVRLRLTGRVQGIGMRPAIARFAQQLALAGYVRNTLGGVEVFVEGAEQDVARFTDEFREQLPDAAEISSSESDFVQPQRLDAFRVEPESRATNPPSDHGELDTPNALTALVPPDVAVCEKCLAEVADAADRRHGYPLTSCTDCGPRYSIVERMPYDREQTSMSGFPLCAACRREFESPWDRRFHAQTTACPDCGPQIWLRGDTGRVLARGKDAVGAAVHAILQGEIVALRGVGGYQLLVDATSQEAVQRLRQRKHRHGKPLAVMVRLLDEAEKLAWLDEAERKLLCDPAGPIVVAQMRDDTPLASSVTNGLQTVGLLLPTTPLHWLLLNSARLPLVCTSANVEGEPLIFAAEEAADRLRAVANVCLEHDRPICRPIDDSVVRVMAGRPVAIRLARGYAPLPLNITSDQSMVALGGHQKAAVALCNGAQSVLGPHIGDLDSIAARQRFVEQTAALSDLYGVEDCRMVSDQHPEYFTTCWADVWADDSAGDRSRAAIRVQHHHAHVVAGMVQHGWLDRQVLGVSFDGTGYGTDGTIWGGEVLRATAVAFERIGHLRPFSLAGGDRAVREPWRVATALVHDAVGAEQAARLTFSSGQAKSLLAVLRSSVLSLRTTSAGRLFDGIAALVLGVETCDFEGQAAMLLEAVCDLSATGQYEIPLGDQRPQQLDWRPLVRQILRERVAGVATGVMAMRFHRGLASAIFNLCRGHSSLPVVLGGGVFQNRILVELLAERFGKTGQPLGLPGMIPPNDGGLAAGQLAVAAVMSRPGRTH